MYLDRCVVCCESDWDDYFELHEITTKDTYILKVSSYKFNLRYYRFINSGLLRISDINPISYLK